MVVAVTVGNCDTRSSNGIVSVGDESQKRVAMPAERAGTRVDVAARAAAAGAAAATTTKCYISSSKKGSNNRKLASLVAAAKEWLRCKP